MAGAGVKVDANNHLAQRRRRIISGGLSVLSGEAATVGQVEAVPREERHAATRAFEVPVAMHELAKRPRGRDAGQRA